METSLKYLKIQKAATGDCSFVAILKEKNRYTTSLYGELRKPKLYVEN
jgi:hypothetical protein